MSRGCDSDPMWIRRYATGSADPKEVDDAPPSWATPANMRLKRKPHKGRRQQADKQAKEAEE